MRTESDACHIWIVVIVEISLETRRTFLEVWTAQRAFRWRSLYSIGKTGWWCAPFWYGAGNFLGRIQAFAEIDNTSRKISRFKVNTYSAVCINAKPIENLQQICAFAVVHPIWRKNYCLNYMSTMSTSNIYSISTLWLGRACPPMTLSYLHPTSDLPYFFRWITASDIIHITSLPIYHNAVQQRLSGGLQRQTTSSQRIYLQCY